MLWFPTNTMTIFYPFIFIWFTCRSWLVYIKKDKVTTSEKTGLNSNECICELVKFGFSKSEVLGKQLNSIEKKKKNNLKLVNNEKLETGWPSLLLLKSKEYHFKPFSLKKKKKLPNKSFLRRKKVQYEVTTYQD